MSQPIQDPGVGTALQRFFRLVGRVRPSLEEYVIPVVSVGDISQNSEPAVSRLCIAQEFTGSVAPDFPTFRIEAQAGTVVRLRKLWFRTQSASYFYLSRAALGTVSTPVTAVLSDARAPGTPNSEVYEDDTTSIASGALMRLWGSTSMQEVDLSHIILSPRENAAIDWVTFQHSVAGESVVWTLLWEEFPIV